MPDIEAVKTLIQLCQMFLVPATVLIAALSNADNERLKTGVSFLGLAVSLIWWASAGQFYAELPEDSRSFWKPFWLSGHALPFLFVVTWLVSMVIHARRWHR
ncbi:unnamed protein product, partial [Phaeothamnion confervicola]